MATSAEVIVLPCDNSSTALVSKAVAVINSEKQSTSDKAPQAQKLSSSDHSAGTDSGYGSLVSSTVSSPAETNPEVASNKFPVVAGTDSGNRRRLFPIRKDQPLRPFDKPVQQEIQKRFNDLNDLYNDALVEFLVKSKVDTRNISIKLKLMGYKEETAKPFVIVLCPKAAYKKVKQFFSERTVKSQYQPQQPGADLPYLEIQIIARPPRLIASAIGVCAPHREITLDFPALCGALVKVDQGERSSFGSLGGMLMATNYSGSTTFYLMSAGHIFNLEHHGSEEHDHEPSLNDDADEDSLEEQSDVDVDVFGIEVAFEQHHGRSAEHFTQEVERVMKLSNLDWPEMDGTWTTSTSTNRKEGRPNLDWALVTVDSFKHYYEPSYLIDEDLVGISKEAVCYKGEGLNSERKVTAFCGVSGQKSGLLSTCMSRLSLSLGGAFVKTYNLTLSDGSGTPSNRRAHILYNANYTTVLQKGDCGSWVIDVESGEVFGHIAAADDFGEAYVVPLDSTLKDMSIDLGMNSVTIPTITEIQDWCMRNWCRPIRLQRPMFVRHENPPRVKKFTPHTDSGYGSMPTFSVLPELNQPEHRLSAVFDLSDSCARPSDTPKPEKHDLNRIFNHSDNYARLSNDLPLEEFNFSGISARSSDISLERFRPSRVSDYYIRPSDAPTSERRRLRVLDRSDRYTRPLDAPTPEKHHLSGVSDHSDNYARSSDAPTSERHHLSGVFDRSDNCARSSDAPKPEKHRFSFLRRLFSKK